MAPKNKKLDERLIAQQRRASDFTNRIHFPWWKSLGWGDATYLKDDRGDRNHGSHLKGIEKKAIKDSEQKRINYLHVMFVVNRNLSMHLEVTHGHIAVCSFCGKRFANQSGWALAHREEQKKLQQLVSQKFH